jgi:catalase (peroxidase I)
MTFKRMGFDDKETVALIVLGHQYGRCHSEVSGYEDPWYAFDPAHWNVYLHGLGYLSIYGALTGGRSPFVEVETAKGKRQFSSNMMGGRWMMLITDMALAWDANYRKHIQFYDRNRQAFHEDSAAAWTKLTENGCKDIGLVEELTPVPATSRGGRNGRFY